jgi:hypothetical protein
MRFVLVFGLCVSAFGQAAAPLSLTHPVQDKNFYLLSLLERLPAVRAAVLRDPALSAIAAGKRGALAKAALSCEADLECYARALRFSGLEIAGADAALKKIAIDSWTGQTWTDAAAGINHIIDVYGLGRAPKYPEIDSISFDVKAESFGRLVQSIAQVLEDDAESMPLFFEPSMRFALALLDANHRDEAGRLEPLEQGENAAALRKLKTVDWGRYPYSVIVVPGSGTDRLSWALSPNGKLRVELAAKRFREGKAPFIMVSGGYVHPSQTPYAEALEMKRSLMQDLGVPEEAIFVEPHARHTTTNMRNAARIMFRDGFPMEKKALVTSDVSQSSYIGGADFAKRCVEELGYVPYVLGARVSLFDLEFLPAKESVRINALEPLDP